MFNQLKNYSFSDRLIQINIRQLFFIRTARVPVSTHTPALRATPLKRRLGFMLSKKKPITFITGDLALLIFHLCQNPSHQRHIFPLKLLSLCGVVISILFSLIQDKSQPKISTPRRSSPVLCGFCLCRGAACCALFLDLGRSSPVSTI
jgi:hypothetical protein